ncbi:uncharacterized protein LOC135836137 isoform X2 [Planococcus citri]|uniref:uncharacterized protein LOC135836137 isoform X2 n=1 Tax=Planococcus citri TaxID=170843 RepID=UPI0031F9B74A
MNRLIRIPGVIECLKIDTAMKSQRIAKFAFDHASRNKISKLYGFETMIAVHKNVANPNAFLCAAKMLTHRASRLYSTSSVIFFRKEIQDTDPKNDPKEGGDVQSLKKKLEQVTIEYKDNMPFLLGFTKAQGILMPEILDLDNKLNKARRYASVFEFLLVSRKLLEIISKYAKECPENEDFAAKLQKKSPQFGNIDSSRLEGSILFRRLLWALATLNKTSSNQIENLRGLLNNDPEKYVWFANQGQRLHEFFSNDVYDGWRLFNVQYIDKNLIPEYVRFLSEDLRDAMLLFWKTQ